MYYILYTVNVNLYKMNDRDKIIEQLYEKIHTC